MRDIMKGFSFELPTKLEFGSRKIEVLNKRLHEMDIERLLIVTDEGIRESGILDRVLSRIQNIELKIYDEVEPNPKDHQVEKGAEIAREFRPDGMLAVGGGSPIDCAKGIGVLLSENGEKISNYYGKETVSGEILPFIAIPTTAGTGSEVTFSAVITDSETERKMSIRSPYIAPDLSILDPGLTISLPESLTSYSGMDAFTHAIEAYTATTATVITDSLALRSIELILDNIERVIEKPEDIEARAAMLLGSTMAGIAFNHSDVASVHCMAESLGGEYDAPHGLCNSIILPYVMEYNTNYCTEKYARVARMMGYKFEDPVVGAEKLVEGIRELNEKIGIPTIKDVGLKKSDIDQLSEMSVNNLSNESNPRPMDKEDYIELFNRLLQD